MKNFFQKKREIVALALYALFIAALVYFVILPLLAKINNVQDQIQEQAMKQQSDMQRLNQLPKVQAQFEAMQQNQSAIDVLLDKNDAVVLIEKLEKLADDSGDKIAITVQDDKSDVKNPVVVNPGNPTPADTALVDALPSKNYLHLQLTLNGDFDSIGKFVKSLESFEYYSDIIAVDIKQKSDTDSSSGVLNTDDSASGILISPFDANGKERVVATSPTAAPASAAASVAPNPVDNELTATLDSVFYLK